MNWSSLVITFSCFIKRNEPGLQLNNCPVKDMPIKAHHKNFRAKNRNNQRVLLKHGAPYHTSAACH